MDMELEPQLEDEIPSAADLLAGTFNISFATYEADLQTSSKTTRPAEIDTLPFENNVIQDGVEQKEDSMRLKRVSKPSVKLISNRLQTDTSKLERLWQATAQTISQLQGTPDSVKALCKAVGDLRLAFNKYQLVWVSLMDFTAYASSPEQRQE